MWVIGKGIEWQGRNSARPWQTSLLAATAPPAFGARWPTAGRRPCLVYAIPFGHRRQSRPYHVAATASTPETGRGSTAHALAPSNETDEASSCPKLDMYVFCKAEQEPCICVTFRIMGQPRFELGFESRRYISGPSPNVTIHRRHCSSTHPGVTAQ